MLQSIVKKGLEFLFKLKTKRLKLVSAIFHIFAPDDRSYIIIKNTFFQLNTLRKKESIFGVILVRIFPEYELFLRSDNSCCSRDIQILVFLSSLLFFFVVHCSRDIQILVFLSSLLFFFVVHCSRDIQILVFLSSLLFFFVVHCFSG